MKTLFTIMLIALTLKCEAQTVPMGEVRGVITYFFNNYQGDKPDMGAKIYIIDSVKVKGLNVATFDSFHYGSSYRNMYDAYVSMNTDTPKNIVEQLYKYHVETKDLFDSLTNRAFYKYYKITDSDDSHKATVDATGSYSIKLKPGIYYVIIQSKGRSDLNLIESQGKIYFKRIRLKNGQTLDLSTNFGLY